MGYPKTVARYITQAKEKRREHGPHTEILLQTASKLAYRLTGKPVAIWLKEPESESITLHGWASFEKADMAGVTADLIAEVGESDSVVRVMESGWEQIVPDIRQDIALQGRGLSQRPNSLALLALPVPSRGGETIGVIGIFDEKPDDLEPIDRQTLTHVAELVAAQAERFHRVRRLADATRQLAKSPNLNDAARIIAQTARELTGAVSSVVWLWNAKTEQFTLASHAAGMAWSVKPRSHGLTRWIIDEGQPIKIDDANEDDRIQEGLKKQGIRSQIGVPIRREEESIGVLFVSSDEPNHFTATDVDLLEVLGGQFSAGFGRAQRLIESVNDVEEAIARLFNLNEILDKLCKKIQSELGFDYVAVQLIRPEERALETVWGTEQVSWVGVKHPMDVHEDLYDIQVDVVRSHPRRIEVLHGWDERFNRWVYDRFEHKNFVRTWAPMLMVRDESNEIERDWWERAHWRESAPKSLPDGGWRFKLELEGIKDIAPRNYPLGVTSRLIQQIASRAISGETKKWSRAAEGR